MPSYNTDYCGTKSVGVQQYTKFSTDFIINKNDGLACEYKRHADVDQVPFVLGIPGPLSLRKGPDSDSGVNRPYTVTISTEPEETTSI